MWPHLIATYVSAGGGRRLALSTTITSAQTRLGTTGTSPTQYYTKGYGFDAGADPFNYGPGFGSISNDTYIDGGGNSRTVSSCYSVYVGITDIWLLYFTLNEDTLPDTDETFHKIVIDGVERLRSDRAVKSSSLSGPGTYWRWDGETGDLFIGANPDDFEVWVN